MGSPAARKPVGYSAKTNPPTDEDYAEAHPVLEAKREVECWFTGKPYRWRAYNRRDYPPYTYRSNVPPKP